MFPTIKFIFLVTTYTLLFPSIAFESESTDPIPEPWPHQFHAITIMNYTQGLRKVDLWYDWPNKRYMHINQYQLGKTLYGVEWQNGTSFYFTLDSTQECTVRHFPVGILRPNWLEGSNYVGQKYKDGFLCNVWDKVGFLRYYEDAVTKIPVYWHFYDGMQILFFNVYNFLNS